MIDGQPLTAMHASRIAESFEFSESKTFKTRVFLQPGALDRLESLGVMEFLRAESQHILVTDHNVEKLYLQKVLASLEKCDRRVRTLIVPASESSKSFTKYTELVEKALDYAFDKHSTIISLGGGVINNLAGFLASTLYRGIGLIHIPTSLLSQVDAAVSFKQAINYRHGKNTIGSLYAPHCIVIDTDVLKTLDLRLVRDGLAESIKHAICQDRDFFLKIRANCNSLLDPTFMQYVVSKSLQLKLLIIDGDISPPPTDFNEAIKHYGHTVGHAVEHLMEGKLYHGESISIGMCVSAEVSRLLDLADDDTVISHYDLFSRVGLPTAVPDALSLSDIVHKMRYDKHYLDGQFYLGLVRAIGVMAASDNEHFGHYVGEKILKQAIINNRKRAESSLFGR